MTAHILFADDNPDTRRLLQRLVAIHQPAVSLALASDGPAAVAAVCRAPTPDLVLLDYWMPPDLRGGLPAAQAIHHLHPALPLFFLSACDFVRLDPAARASGAWGWLGKEAICRPGVLAALLSRDWPALRRPSIALFEENLPQPAMPGHARP